MNVIKLTKVLGILGIGFGIIAISLCFFPNGIVYGILAGLPGFICSSTYVVLNERYLVSNRKLNNGVIGLVLNSIPLLIVITIMFILKKNS